MNDSFEETIVWKKLLNIVWSFAGYIGEFEIIEDHRAGKIVVNLTGRLNKVSGLINVHLHNKCIKL